MIDEIKRKNMRRVRCTKKNEENKKQENKAKYLLYAKLAPSISVQREAYGGVVLCLTLWFECHASLLRSAKKKKNFLSW